MIVFIDHHIEHHTSTSNGDSISLVDTLYESNRTMHMIVYQLNSTKKNLK